jgi:O-phospho-L-seryl-tRNASec:L-selenocysteinyl-tRNA synthase
MGFNGYKELLDKRNLQSQSFGSRLQQVAEKHGERVLKLGNSVSFAMTLDQISDNPKDISKLGAMLFSRCVSGTRVVPRGEQKVMGGMEFCGFGSSVDNYPHAYMTAACAIGVTDKELDEFLIRLDKTLKDAKKKAKT